MSDLTVKAHVLDWRILEWNQDNFGVRAPLVRATRESAAFDLYACIDEPRHFPGEHEEFIPVGFSLEIQEGYAGIILPRSGLGCKEGLVLGNLVGLIDSDYRDPILVNLWSRRDICAQNHSTTVRPGDRIAQILFMQLPSYRGFPVAMRERMGGFGSTGVSVNKEEE